MKHLSTKLTVIVLAICIAGMGSLAAVGIVLFRTSLMEQSLQRIRSDTLREAERINGWLSSHQAYVESMAQDLMQEADLSPGNIRTQLQLRAQLANYSDVYVGFPDGRIIMSTGYEPDYAGGYAANRRPWYTGAYEAGSAVAISSPYVEVETQRLMVAVSKIIERDGSLIGVGAVDIPLDEVTAIVGETWVGAGSYAFLTDEQDHIIIHPLKEYGPLDVDRFQNLAQVDGGRFAALAERGAADFSPLEIINTQGVRCYYTAASIPAANWTLYSVISKETVLRPVRRIMLLFGLIAASILAGAAILTTVLVRRTIVRPISDVTRAAGELTKGSVSISIQNSYDTEIGEMIQSFLTMAESIERQAACTQRIAMGDLTGEVPVRSEQDVMGRALNGMKQGLGEMVLAISDAAAQTAASSQQISSATQVLAQGTTEQAAAVKGLSSSISKLLEKTRLSEEHAERTGKASAEIVGSIRRSAFQMEEMLQAVNEIADSSSGISRVINVIDSIAFQTNILALNAAVEAARAGIHGKGFAVVAEEVGNLAAKSAEAARETAKLLETSNARATEGARIAQETNRSLQDIVDEISGTLLMVEGIGNTTKEQSLSLQKIRDGVEQINLVVASTASYSQQCAASAETLFQEANGLMKIVGQFTVEGSVAEISWESPVGKPESGFSASGPPTHEPGNKYGL